MDPHSCITKNNAECSLCHICEPIHIIIYKWVKIILLEPFSNCKFCIAQTVLVGTGNHFDWFHNAGL